jgi:alkylation response protein AidB-like acyl-CoA dehydrogenase
MQRDLYTDEHEVFRDVVRTFVEREVRPHLTKWDEDRSTGREVWLAAGRQGVIGLSGPEECGGAGLSDFRFRNVVIEEIARVGSASLQSSFSLQDDILIPYLTSLATPQQRSRWLAPMCAGEKIAAIAMTEPGAGSDLRGIRTRADKVSGGWKINGAKTFITSGIQSDLVVVVARTGEPGAADGFSLIVVEEGTAGFSRGRKLDKIGMLAQDTAELYFDDVFVPEENLLGTEGAGFRHLMYHLPLERFGIAAAAIAAADAAFAWTLDYVKEREAFGQRIADFQNTQFVLAEISTELDVTRAYVDKCVLALSEGKLSAVEASKAKLWATDVQVRTIDRLLQLYGGYGYMLEYPIARAYRDARVQKIYGGTNEVMKLIVGRDLVGRG